MSLPDPPLAPSTQAFRPVPRTGVIDLNPGGRRAHHVSRFRQHLRLSFGPDRAEVERGLDRLEELIASRGAGAQRP